MKETKLEIPAGCEVDKIETQDGHIVVTFREKERKLPKSWEEFCEMFPIKKGECSINFLSEILQEDVDLDLRNPVTQRKELPDHATAEAVLALCQLVQLRNAYNGDWKPDWDEGDEIKHCIDYTYGDICTCANCISPLPLYFITAELRDEFLRNFRPLIEKLKPLYGIEKGGKE